MYKVTVSVKNNIGDTMEFSYKKTAAAVIVFTLLLTTLLIIIGYRSAPAKKENYMLKNFEGTAALFRGDEVITVYDGVVISALPLSDRQRFFEGIPVLTPEDAQTIIEDYDG